MPIVNVEFYRPDVLGDNAPPFRQVLEQLAGLTALQRIRRGLDPAAILSIAPEGDGYIGEAARIRMEDLPSVIDLATARRHNLNVGAQEGLGEEIHFLYDPQANIIAIQRKGHFRATALRYLISDLTDVPLDFQVVLRQDAWERFQNMPLVRKVEFTLARPHDLGGARRPALMRVFRMIDEFNGIAAKVEITVGRRERGLVRDTVAAVVNEFRARADDFKALSITGAVRDDEGEHPDTVDFIKGRLVFRAEVDRRGRRLDPEGCRLVLRRAIRTNRAYLRRYRG